MKRRYLIPTLVLTMILIGNLASAALINGIIGPGDEAPPTSESEPIFRLPFGIFIDFDETLQPPSFLETIALTDEYLGLGVSFSGPNPGDGGGVLNEVGNFGVSGYSAPNFLAFNCEAEFIDGHRAVGPQRLDFPVLVTLVSALVGSGNGAGSNLTLDAYDAAGNLVDSSNLELTNVMQELSVEAFAISYVIFGQEAPCVWILDDLGFNLGPVATEKSTWSRVKGLYR